MNIPPEKVVPACLAAFCFQIGVGAAQTSFQNVDFGFETGAFNPAISFAGGTAHVLASPGASTTAVSNALPSSPWVGQWTPSEISTGVYWVESVAAFEGSKYLYLDGKDTSLKLIYGDGTGQPYAQALTPGEEYKFCIRVAAGSSSEQKLHVKWTDLVGGGFEFDVPIPANPAWSTSQLSTIPWERICFSYTPLSANGSISFGTSTSSQDFLLVDGFSLEPFPVPEPSSAFLAAMGLMLVVRRRR